MILNNRHLLYSLTFLLLISCVSQNKKGSYSSIDSFTDEDFNWKELTGKPVFVASRANYSPEVQAEVFSIPAIQQLEDAKEKMPESLSSLTQNFINELLMEYPDLTEHQKEMLRDYATCNMRVLSKETNPKRFSFVHNKMHKSFVYLRDTRGIRSGYAFVGNVSKKEVGGQVGYIVNMATGELVEFDISSAWKGVGYENDSGQTPLGYFLIYKDYHQKGWQAKTLTTDTKNIFHKIEGQSFEGEAKYLYRKNTKEEKAFICSNQFGLIGQNFGSELIDLAAPKYLDLPDEEVCYIDNSNSGSRQIYVHGSNRVDQLGFALSGGCIRISNINSYIFREIILKQETMPVFLDAVAYHEPKPVQVPGFDDTDLESIYNTQSIVIRRQNLLDSISLNRQLYSKVLPELANSIAYRMSKIGNQKASIDIKITVPFPETAMKYWLAKHRIEDFTELPLQQTFGFRGEYYKNVNRRSSNPFFKDYNTDEINTYFTERITDTKEALEVNLMNAFEKYELETDSLYALVEISEQSQIDGYFNANLDSIDPFEYFSISDERRRVLTYMELIDTLTQIKPEAIENWEHLTWIDKYMAFRDNIPYEQFELDYHDVVLMQAYIYAMGEQELYMRDVKAGKLVSARGEPFYTKLVDRYGIEKALSMLDEAGMWKLFQYSHSSENKTLMKMVSVAYPKDDMAKGMRTLAEAYFSQYKWAANQYVITSEVNGDVISMAD